MSTRSGAPVPRRPTVASPCELHPIAIDHAPGLLQASYALRYQVYCVECGFLQPSAYPDGCERDEWDASAAHVGAVDRNGTLWGTARLVPQTASGDLPGLHHCQVYPEDRRLFEPPYRFVELSRLCSRRPGRLARAAGDPATASDLVGPPEGQIFLSVLRAAYRATLTMNATHWLGATERAVVRLFIRQGFPFRQVGPIGDYYGPVALYAMDLAEFAQGIADGRAPALAHFLEELPASGAERSA